MSGPAKKVGQYRLFRKIGKGATSQVYEGIKEGAPHKYAIKVVNFKGVNKPQKDLIVKEINIIKGISHANIVHLHDTLQTTTNYYLIFQLCQKGDLEKYLRQYYGDKVPEKIAQKIIYCLADALLLIHNRGIVHRDIKLANILINNDFQIKLADFGFAKALNENFYTKTYCGTPITMAPEIFLQLPYDRKCDIWSLGIILFQLVYGKLPFSTSNGLQKFIKCVTNSPLEIPNNPKMPFEFKELILRCLQKNPAKRMDIRQFMENRWVREGSSKVQIQRISRRKPTIQQLLKNIAQDKGKIDEDEVEDEESVDQQIQIELLVGQRINKALAVEVRKIISSYMKLRISLNEKISEKHKLRQLFLALDNKYLQFIRKSQMLIGKENVFHHLKIEHLQGLEFPQPLSPNCSSPEPAGLAILNFLKEKSSQTCSPQQKIKEYGIIIDLMEMLRRFELKATLLFSSHFHLEIDMNKVLQNIRNKVINEEVEEEIEYKKGNFITILVECYDREQKMRKMREKLVANCERRIGQIREQL